MEHQDFNTTIIHNPKKVAQNIAGNTPKEIIAKKHQEQKIVKTDESGEIVKINKITSIISNFIKNARSEKKMTQKELAQKTNLPLKTISDIEKGTSLYVASDINKISKALGINIPRS